MSDEYAGCVAGVCHEHEKHCEDCRAPIPERAWRGAQVDRCRPCFEVWQVRRPLLADVATLVGGLWRSKWLSEPLGAPGLIGDGLHAAKLRELYPCFGCSGRCVVYDPKYGRSVSCPVCYGSGYRKKRATEAGELSDLRSPAERRVDEELAGYWLPEDDEP